jgi:small nuclear ribonucleoprotein (snRNP)-like protein
MSASDIAAGILKSTDSYMNFQVRPRVALCQHSCIQGCHSFFVQLANSEEFIDGAFTGNLGEILIRCNNVLYVRAAPADVA